MTPMMERGRIKMKLARLSILIFLVLGSAGETNAQPLGTSREYEIKVAFLYNFGKYVEWPADEQAAFTIGVVGDDPFGKSLDELAQTKTLGERRITIRRIRKPTDFGECHILFFPRDTPAELSQFVLAKARQEPCLIVGEQAGFAESGGIVNFFVQNNRVRFEINPSVAKKRNLRISSKLLQLGRIVGESDS